MIRETIREMTEILGLGRVECRVCLPAGPLFDVIAPSQSPSQATGTGLSNLDGSKSTLHSQHRNTVISNTDTNQG